MEKTYIFGHKNPDTDSVCASISLSYLKNKMGMNTEPRILSNINGETEYALKKFGFSTPEYLNDVKVQLKDIKFHKNYFINENESIYNAFSIINKTGITGIPLVDDKKKMKGYVSLKEIASAMVFNESLRIETDFDNLLSTLEATEYLKFDNQIVGYAHAATLNDDDFMNSTTIDEESIIIVGNRENILKNCIEKNVKLIILVKNQKISKEMKKLAKEHKVNLIFTPKSAFKIARVLCLSNPIKTIKRNQMTISFNINDYLTDFVEQTTKLKHTNYPIVDNKGVCLGMLRTIDAHEITKKKVILVDHNMLNQSVDGLYESDILEIIDHHNIGDINTSTPINFRNMSVGSTNTIIYYLFKESGVKIPKNIAGLMLSGIISDTLLLQSPTTTSKDKMVAQELAKISGVNLKKYGTELLESGVSIEGVAINDIVMRDFKRYKVENYTMGIGQVFTTDFQTYKSIVNEIVDELNRIADNNDYKVCALYVTNFLTNNSYLIYSKNSEHILEIAYGINNIKEGIMLKNVVSRKKQMVPNVMDVLMHM